MKKNQDALNYIQCATLSYFCERINSDDLGITCKPKF